MEIFDKEEIELIKNFREEKLREEKNMETRREAWCDLYKAIKAFQEAGGIITDEEDNHGNYLLLEDVIFNEEQKRIVFYF